MKEFKVSVRRTIKKSEPIEADGVQSAIELAIGTVGPGFTIEEVEWDGGSAEVYGQCENCETFCVCVFEDGGDESGVTNYEHDVEGVPLCDPCMAALIAEAELEAVLESRLATGEVVATETDES